MNRPTNRRLTSELAWVRAACLSGEARRIRQAANITQAEIGAEIGGDTTPLAPITVMRWETGKRLPGSQYGLAYAAVLRSLRRASTRVPA